MQEMQDQAVNAILSGTTQEDWTQEKLDGVEDEIDKEVDLQLIDEAWT